jgi:hypothetical protein
MKKEITPPPFSRRADLEDPNYRFSYINGEGAILDIYKDMAVIIDGEASRSFKFDDDLDVKLADEVKTVSKPSIEIVSRRGRITFVVDTGNGKFLDVFAVARVLQRRIESSRHPDKAPL